MCGIVGIYLKTKKFENNLGKMLSGMLNNMESRGPDSAGFAIYKNSDRKEYKYSLCINNLDFSKFKKNISQKIKNLKLNQYSDHVILKTTEKPKKLETSSRTQETNKGTKKAKLIYHQTFTKQQTEMRSRQTTTAAHKIKNELTDHLT